MYSPKIREELIPRIYQAAKASGTPMTKWVNRILESALPAAPEPQILNDKCEMYDQTNSKPNIESPSDADR